MKVKYIISFLIIQLVVSCIPYKKIVYMQGELPENVRINQSYKIKKSDILYIKIRSSNENIDKLFAIETVSASNNLINANALYFNGYTVDEQGYIELPVINKIYVEGKTFKEVKKDIQTKLLEKQFKSLDNIFIKVKLAGIPYTIIGEVNNPKTGVLYKEQPTLFDVIGDAGDLSQVANRNKVIVVRTENGKQVKKELDLTRADVVDSPYFYVRPNDIVYVQPLKQKTWGTGTTLQQTISTTITALSLITTIILLSKYTQ